MDFLTALGIMFGLALVISVLNIVVGLYLIKKFNDAVYERKKSEEFTNEALNRMREYDKLQVYDYNKVMYGDKTIIDCTKCVCPQCGCNVWEKREEQCKRFIDDIDFHFRKMPKED